MTIDIERRILQIILVAIVLVPLTIAVPSIFQGPEAAGGGTAASVDFDSHFRYLSGVLLAMAVALASCIPHIEWRGGRFRLVGVMIITGGLGQFWSYATIGEPSRHYMIALVVSLLLMPVLLIWQASLASRWRRLRMPMV